MLYFIQLRIFIFYFITLLFINFIDFIYFIFLVL